MLAAKAVKKSTLISLFSRSFKHQGPDLLCSQIKEAKLLVLKIPNKAKKNKVSPFFFAAVNVLLLRLFRALPLAISCVHWINVLLSLWI